MPISRSWSLTMKRYSSLVTTIGSGATAGPGMPLRRTAVSCSRECGPASGSSCLG